LLLSSFPTYLWRRRMEESVGERRFVGCPTFGASLLWKCDFPRSSPRKLAPRALSRERLALDFLFSIFYSLFHLGYCRLATGLSAISFTYHACTPKASGHASHFISKLTALRPKPYSRHEPHDTTHSQSRPHRSPS